MRETIFHILNRLAVVIGMFPLVAIAASASAQCDDTEVTRLDALDGAGGDNFGITVAVSGGWSVAGSPGDDDMGSGAGAVYIYKQSGLEWIEYQKLVALDGQAGDAFGAAVAISGNTIVVGATGDDEAGFNSNSGAAFVFKLVGTIWVQTQKLLPTDLASSDGYGSAVAIDLDIAVIGSPKDDDAGTSSGSAYAFKNIGTTWVPAGKLRASDGAVYDQFGSAVAVANGTAIVGAFGDDDLGAASGAAYIFDYNGSEWLQRAKLLPSNGAADDNFGIAVDIDADIAVVGSPNYGTDDRGAAFVFREFGTSWDEEQQLGAASGNAFDSFGRSVGVGNGVIVVGAPDAFYNGMRPGLTYSFASDTAGWVEQATIVAPNSANSDYFGSAASVADGLAAIGAYGDDDNGLSAGCIYVLGLGGTAGSTSDDCNGNGVSDLCDIANGDAHDENGNGVPDECETATPCFADLVSSTTLQPPGDGRVDASDLAFLLGQWGVNAGSPADLISSGSFAPPADGVVDAADLSALLSAWGDCP